MKRTALWIIFLLIFVVCCASLSACNFHIHAYGEWTVVKAANCTQDGLQERYCSCGEKQTVTINATGHTFDDWTVIKQASCSEVGQQERTCSCGEKESATIPVLPHTFGAWTTVRESTCTQKGQEERVCGCGAKETRDIDLADHTKEILPAVDATCAATGLTEGSRCSVCGATITAQQIVDALDHSFTNYVSDNNATCTVDGTKTAKCDRCDETDTINDVGSAKGHAYSDEWSMDDTYHWYAATCEHSSEVKDKAEHYWDEGVITIESTETRDGEKTYTCKVCGKTKTVIISMGTKYTVTFVDFDGTELKTQEVYGGENATPPANPEREGWRFTGWDCDCTNVSSNLVVTAQYRIKTFTVIFQAQGVEIDKQIVAYGHSAEYPVLNDLPNFPKLYFDFENITVYQFSGWDLSLDNITENTTIVAKYEEPYQQPVIFVKQSNIEVDGKTYPNKLTIRMYCPSNCYIYGVEFSFDWKNSGGYISEYVLPQRDGNTVNQSVQYYNDANKSFKYMMIAGNGLISETGCLDIATIIFSNADGFTLSVDKINIATNCTIIYGPSDANVEDLIKITPIVVVE